MNPAFSVIFLTTLIGAGQGLFLALYTAQSYAAVALLPPQAGNFYWHGSLLALVLLVGGLIASFFHLGHPERAWRSAARWRTSWLSREVIVLPAVMIGVLAYGMVWHLGWDFTLVGIYSGVPNDLALLVGLGTMLLTFLLFLCTGMIYACIKFLQEWASPLTVINYLLLGTASGFTLATAFSAYTAPALIDFYAVWAIIITLAAFVTRVTALLRNARIKYKSTVQTAIGVRHVRVAQKAQGLMGGSVNTRDFFHHASAGAFRSIKWLFLILVFAVPVALLWAGLSNHAHALIAAAFITQYLGLLLERWFFFAQANHPQNLYYQAIS
jgi:sulfite dehydrogenase (quinone) subunit SoeC